MKHKIIQILVLLISVFSFGQEYSNILLSTSETQDICFYEYSPSLKIKEELRLVSYYHKEKNKAYHFLTNLFDLPADQIALLYKKRWEIELLFKKIKQNFPLQYFYGNNKNAIQIQIWCTLIALLLITIMKKKLTKVWSFSNLVSLLQKHLFTYVKFTDFFNNIDAFAKEFIKNKGNTQSLQLKINFNST